MIQANATISATTRATRATVRQGALRLAGWCMGLALCTPALALNVLLCNDDSAAAANLRALKQTLTAAGHRVIVTAPADNQSGSGGALAFLRPISPLSGHERAAKAFGLVAGTPGVGTDPTDAEVFYVNGSPVAACLYGIDVQAARQWQAPPDLVISGPNEGSNIGAINASSGTFNNLLYAVARQMPALAVSDAQSSRVDWRTDLPADDHAYEVAGVVLKLVNALTTQARPPGAPLLPIGLGLNVNIPAHAQGGSGVLPIRWTRLGYSSDYMPVFYEKLSESPLAVKYGAGVARPGISIAPGGSALPSGITLPEDDSAEAETNVLGQGNAITVSPVQATPEVTGATAAALQRQLNLP